MNGILVKMTNFFKSESRAIKWFNEVAPDCGIEESFHELKDLGLVSIECVDII